MKTLDSRKDDPKNSRVLVLDVFLRLWHWAFAGLLSASLATELIGDLTLMGLHMVFGYIVIGLVLFRCGWFFLGGAYARWRYYKPSLRLTLEHFRGTSYSTPHTAPGVLMAISFLAVVVAQIITGLFTTDDIINSGPLTEYAGASLVSDMTWLHNRIFWVIIGLIGVHVCAHLLYLYRRNSDVYAMFTGRKHADLPPTSASTTSGIGILLASALTVWGFLELL